MEMEQKVKSMNVLFNFLGKILFKSQLLSLDDGIICALSTGQNQNFSKNGRSSFVRNCQALLS